MKNTSLPLIGNSAYMAGLRRRISAVARGSFPVLIQGDSGTGKELVAQAIHAQSERGDKHMVAVNCAAVPKHLEESEFFGHVKGAFTGADQAKLGLVERANESTLFLDEIGETSADIQAKLLRVLDSGEFIPVGTTEPRRTDIRVVSATNRNLRGMVDHGFFRPDLYFRLKGIVVSTEPLSTHRKDIAVLVDHFLGQVDGDSMPREVDSDAMALLSDYDWPGDVRELRYTVDVLCMAAHDRESIDAQTVRTVLDLSLGSDSPAHGPYHEDKKKVVEDFDRRYFVGLLRACRGNVSEVARTANLYRPSVQRKLQALGIDAAAYRRKR